MNPDNKKFMYKMFDTYPVSVIKQDKTIIYYTTLPDTRKLAICADLTFFNSEIAVIYYTASLDDDILDEAIVDTSKKALSSVASDIIDLMRLCSTKIMMQEAHLRHSKFMVHEIKNSKSYS